MTKCIYLAWQDQNTRRWHVIGQLLRFDEGYEFRYTIGVNNIPFFTALPNMPEHERVYRSLELFSLFKNRLMPKSRPDYSDYVRWMGIEQEDMDELDALAISGGERETDFFRIIPVPEKNAKGDYSFKFFVNGLSHMDDHVKERVRDLHKGDSLYLMHDFQNTEDQLALSVRTEDPPCLIGYIPAYFTKVIHKMKNEKENAINEIRVNVVQVNEDAPIQMRLLCELSSSFLNKPWEEYETEFKLISS
jgi:hypothetical protein